MWPISRGQHFLRRLTQHVQRQRALRSDVWVMGAGPTISSTRSGPRRTERVDDWAHIGRTQSVASAAPTRHASPGRRSFSVGSGLQSPASSSSPSVRRKQFQPMFRRHWCGAALVSSFADVRTVRSAAVGVASRHHLVSTPASFPHRDGRPRRRRRSCADKHGRTVPVRACRSVTLHVGQPAGARTGRRQRFRAERAPEPDDSSDLDEQQPAKLNVTVPPRGKAQRHEVSRAVRVIVTRRERRSPARDMALNNHRRIRPQLQRPDVQPEPYTVNGCPPARGTTNPGQDRPATGATCPPARSPGPAG